MAATISKGTLNLRFMQNAHRADKQELTSAESITKEESDESRWEVAREVKDMWGMTSAEDPPSTSSLVTHEASYLPFVLSRYDTSGSPPHPIKLRGRRTWNKRGQEVVTEAATEIPSHNQPLQDNDEHEDGDKDGDDESRGSPSARRRVPAAERHHHHHAAPKRLTSISGFRSGPPSDKESKRAKPRSAKSARDIIREAPPPSGTRATRTDAQAPPISISRTTPPSPPLPASSPNQMLPSDAAAAAPKFLKPAGVDEPQSAGYVARKIGSRATAARVQQEADADHGPQTRTRTQRRNLKKRAGDDDVDEAREARGAPTADDVRKRRKGGAAAAAS